MRKLIVAIGWRPFAALTTGIFSLILLIYFYVQQRHFEGNYKTVLAHSHTLDRTYHRLSYDVLRISLFAYVDQDAITAGVEAMEKEYRALRYNPFLKQRHYAETARRVAWLGEALQMYETSMNDFLMLNAGIKNSFVFITSLSAEKIRLFENDPETYTLLLSIIAQVSQARVLSDASFLKDLNARAEALGRLGAMTQEQAALIRSFLIHVHYIAANYPGFVRTITRIESSELQRQIADMEDVFQQEAQTDNVMLDRFVIILLTLFLLALVLVVGLLIHAAFENRRLRRLEEQLRHSLSHDQLTGLLSRSRFETLQDTFEQPALLLLNIDQFKHINDFYGGAAGNAILKEVSLLIRQPVLGPYHPQFFRLGGDDFGVVLQNVEAERARQLGSMLKQTIEGHAFAYDNIEVFITVTVAVNYLKPLLENADLILKHEKLRHSESVALFSEAMQLKEKVKTNIAMTYEVKKALDRDAVVPWFQPIVDLRSGQVVKYEALVRLVGVDGEISIPERFLSTAMQTPYYRRITVAMLQKVFETMDKHPCRFSLNLGMRDLADEKLVMLLLAELDAHRDRAGRLDIELLESEELDDLDAVRTFIAKVKAYGCGVSLDDFGSGYSNFSYVMELDVDTLKIDGSLVRKMALDAKTLRTVETIVRFAHQLGLKVIAEYVESASTAEKLRGMGVEYAQGYHFGRPLPAMEGENADGGKTCL